MFGLDSFDDKFDKNRYKLTASRSVLTKVFSSCDTSCFHHLSCNELITSIPNAAALPVLSNRICNESINVNYTASTKTLILPTELPESLVTPISSDQTKSLPTTILLDDSTFIIETREQGTSVAEVEVQPTQTMRIDGPSIITTEIQEKETSEVITEEEFASTIANEDEFVTATEMKDVKLTISQTEHELMSTKEAEVFVTTTFESVFMLTTVMVRGAESTIKIEDVSTSKMGLDLTTSMGDELIDTATPTLQIDKHVTSTFAAHSRVTRTVELEEPTSTFGMDEAMPTTEASAIPTAGIIGGSKPTSKAGLVTSDVKLVGEATSTSRGIIVEATHTEEASIFTPIPEVVIEATRTTERDSIFYEATTTTKASLTLPTPEITDEASTITEVKNPGATTAKVFEEATPTIEVKSLDLSIISKIIAVTEAISSAQSTPEIDEVTPTTKLRSPVLSTAGIIAVKATTEFTSLDLATSIAEKIEKQTPADQDTSGVAIIIKSTSMSEVNSFANFTTETTGATQFTDEFIAGIMPTTTEVFPLVTTLNTIEQQTLDMLDESTYILETEYSTTAQLFNEISGSVEMSGDDMTTVKLQMEFTSEVRDVSKIAIAMSKIFYESSMETGRIIPTLTLSEMVYGTSSQSVKEPISSFLAKEDEVKHTKVSEVITKAIFSKKTMVVEALSSYHEPVVITTTEDEIKLFPTPTAIIPQPSPAINRTTEELPCSLIQPALALFNTSFPSIRNDERIIENEENFVKLKVKQKMCCCEQLHDSPWPYGIGLLQHTA